MMAAIFAAHGPPDVLRIQDVPAPEPGPGEVRIRVRAASLNHLDLWVRRGIPIETPMPHIGGADVAGEVEALGPGGDDAWLGRRVVVDPSLGWDWYEQPGGPSAPLGFRLIGEHTQGGFAELCVVPVANLVPLPDAFPFEVAAAAGLVTVTAWHGLIGRGALRAGETVLITGASGGVATMAIQVARLAGARVLAVTRGRDRVERVRKLGADLVYDRSDEDWPRAARRDVGRAGVDLVFDSVGGPTWGACLRLLAPRGRLVCYGATAGPRADAELAQVFWKQLSILGSTMGSPAEYRTAMGLVFEGRLTPVIHEILPLSDARGAHEALEDGGVFGKLVLVP